MKPGRWEEVEKLYNSTLEREPDMRAAFLAEAAAGNDSLRAEVESLLEHRERRGSFLEAPAIGMVAGELVAGSVSSKGAQAVGDSQPMDDVNRKPRKRAPWWMYAVAVAFLICAAVRYYASYIAPEDSGIRGQLVRDRSGLVTGVVVKTVQPGSAAARAGLEPGDISLNMQSPMTLPFDPLYWEAGHSYRIEIKRKEESKTVFLTLRRDPLTSYVTGLRSVNLILALTSVLCLSLAGIIAFTRPYDPAARWGALFMAIMATGLISMFAPLGVNSTILKFPRMAGWLIVLLPSFCTACYASVGITFFAVFPRRLFQRPWAWALAWLPAVIVMPLQILRDRPPIYSFPRWWPNWYENLYIILVFVCSCALLTVLILNYLRLRDLNERRRVRIVVVGFTVATIAVVPLFIRRLGLGAPAKPWFVLACLVSAFPIAMAYAILRHRLFDIRVIIRLGLRYAAARGALLSLVPIVAAVLAGDLLLHGNQPLMQILGHRGLLYAVLAGGGFLLHMRRRVWLDAIDRRFFREHYDAQRVLRAVVDEVREARNFEKVAPRVVSQVEAALHPEFAALLMRQPGESKYCVLAASEKAPPPIAADSKLMILVRVLGKPVEIPQSQTGWPWSQLPQHEIEFLRHARLEWLFPICLVEGQTEALLAMGPKRSEEPYSREDQELLQVITSSLALLLEESPAAAREGFEECPECGTCYDSGSGSCRKEGAKLTPLPFPRLLAHRYRFEQRLGEGGMGMVYQALDTQLERRVAVKLIRPDLTAEAAARFKREARAAASFAHPNVVTVFDFDVAEDRGAYLVMELLCGSTLRKELSRQGRFPAARASEVLGGVCTAVDVAHKRQLLHRDLKPENIFLVNSEGVEAAKILDFGVVKPIAPADTTQTAGQTGPGMLVGTLKYMSPEQLRGEEPAESWDLWALAVVAYEMLAGAHPFAGSTALDVRDAVLAGRITPLRRHLSDAPPGWQRFFDQALASRVELRPNSALQLFSNFKHSIQQDQRHAAI